MGPGRNVYIVPYGVVACARLSDSIVPTYQNEQKRLFITISEAWNRLMKSYTTLAVRKGLKEKAMHLLVWSYSNQVGGIKRIKRVRLHYVCAAPSGRVFAPFWSENGYTPILVWNRVWFLRELRPGVYERIYRFNSKWVTKKEKYANSEWIWRIFWFAL